MSDQTTSAGPITGRAAGVPFHAVPPAGGVRPDAPVVLAWHLLDAPRTETAFAAALPLRDLDAWRVYLGLPMSGSRLPAGGYEELMALGYEDAVLRMHGPIVDQATEEFGRALPELRERLSLADGPLGVMGGSIGAAVAALVMAECDVTVRSAVLVSPVVQLRRAVEAGERTFGVPYHWSEESRRVAERLDFVARADDIARHRADVLLVVGADDDTAFVESAGALRDALGSRAALNVVPGMGHALAEEPGTDAAPQTPQARQVDRLAASWFAEAFGAR